MTVNRTSREIGLYFGPVFGAFGITMVLRGIRLITVIAGETDLKV